MLRETKQLSYTAAVRNNRYHADRRRDICHYTVAIAINRAAAAAAAPHRCARCCCATAAPYAAPYASPCALPYASSHASPHASSHASLMHPLLHPLMHPPFAPPLCTPPLCTLPLVQVRKMLCYDPAARVSAREVVAHPWIRSQVPDPLSTRLCTSQHPHAYPHASPHAPLCTPVDTLPGRPLSNLAALHGLSQRINGRNHLGLLRVPPHRSTCPRSRRPPRPAAAATAAAASPARR